MQQHKVGFRAWIVAPVEVNNDSTVMWWQGSAQKGQQAWSEGTVTAREGGWQEEEGSNEFAGDAKTVATKSGQSQYH